MTDYAWFVDSEGSILDVGDTVALTTRIREGSADSPTDWSAEAVDAGFAEDEEEYYESLHDATITAAREEAREAARADDQQLMHALRAMDDAERTANELAERLSEWAGSVFDDVGAGVDGARDVAAREPATPTEERVASLANRVVDLADERDQLRASIERRTPDVAPNLSEMAGPVLAARLVSLAGGLESLAKKPSGTVQVLGAEGALFAHLRGHAPSPKHGVIFTHEFVSGTRPEDRGSAARALAGKLTIAARIDHYSGEMRPELHEELRDRMETIRARADGCAGDGDGTGDNDGGVDQESAGDHEGAGDQERAIDETDAPNEAGRVDDAASEEADDE